MNVEIVNLTERALNLSPGDRTYLAEVLLDSLDDEQDFSVSKEWLREIEVRCRELDSGTATPVSGEDGLRELKRKYA